MLFFVPFYFILIFKKFQVVLWSIMVEIVHILKNVKNNIKKVPIKQYFSKAIQVAQICRVEILIPYNDIEFHLNILRCNMFAFVCVASKQISHHRPPCVFCSDWWSQHVGH